jgi:hypothetical protein
MIEGGVVAKCTEGLLACSSSADGDAARAGGASWAGAEAARDASILMRISCAVPAEPALNCRSIGEAPAMLMRTCLLLSIATLVTSAVCHFCTGVCKDIYEPISLSLHSRLRPQVRHALSDSLAKNSAPFPTPRVPFFFFPFLSTSDTGQVCTWSGCAAPRDAATRSAGST